MMLQKLKKATPTFWKMALSLPLIAALVFVYSCQQSEIEESQPATNTASAKSQLSIEEILDKYRSKYPDITIEAIHMLENPDGSSKAKLTVKNVTDTADKQKIEEEISQAAQTFLTSKPLVPAPLPAPDAPLSDEIFQVVEEQPVPVKGFDAFFQYIGENMQYPQQAREKGIEGKVFVQFVVDSDGSITNISVLKGIGGGCDEEAVKVIAGSPKWLPGKQNGKPVRVRMSVPIAFKLN